jgi:tetratricopeptide (TPR) repeat protein
MELGMAYAESNRWGPAIDRFQQILILDPQFAPAHYGLGRVYYEQQRYAEAETELLLATRLNPQYTDAYAALAFVNEAVGDRVGAVASLEKAVALLKARGTAAGQTSQGPPLTKEERTLLKRLEKGLEKLRPAASTEGKGGG